MADQNADSMRSQRTKLPPRCVHCKAREPLDADGFCLDYHACVQRQPLGARRRGTAQIDSSGGGVVSQNADSVSANIHKGTPTKVFADDVESTPNADYVPQSGGSVRLCEECGEHVPWLFLDLTVLSKGRYRHARCPSWAVVR